MPQVAQQDFMQWVESSAAPLVSGTSVHALRLIWARRPLIALF